MAMAHHKGRCTFSKAHHFGALHVALLAWGCDAKSLVDMTARVSWVGLGVVWERKKKDEKIKHMLFGHANTQYQDMLL